MSPRYKPPSVDTIPEPPEDLVAPVSRERAGHDGAPDERPGQSMAGEDGPVRNRLTDTRQPHRHQRLPVHRHAAPDARPRSVGSRRASVPATVGSPRSKSAHYQRRHTLAERREASPAGLSDSDSNSTEAERVRRRGVKAPPRPPRPPGQSLLSSLATAADGATATGDSGSSSGSGSTITQVSYTRREHEGRAEDDAARLVLRGASARPDVLSFLDADSPAVTAESIQRSLTEASAWRSHDGHEPVATATARSASSSSSSSSSSGLVGFRSGSLSSSSTAEMERSTSPGHGDATARPTPVDQPRASGAEQPAERRRPGPAYRYGTPEMPRGNANLPHLPASALTPRVPDQGHVKHLPRAEKLPLSGYELLADRLSSSSRGHARRPSTASPFTSRRGSVGSNGAGGGGAGAGGEGRQRPPQARIKPIYRRFEALNHRLLLHLQDELSELEEQLHRLDTADTQNRRVQDRILPASRRAEALAGGELQWHKTDILGKIGFKLGQYNHVLASFTSTRDLPSPPLSDVDRYRAFLAREGLIVEMEARFLDPVEDLVTLASSSPAPSRSSSSGSTSASEPEDLPTRPEYHPAVADDVLTPMPGAGGRAPSSYLPSPTPSSGSTSVFSRPRTANTTQATTSGEGSPAAGAGPGAHSVRKQQATAGASPADAGGQHPAALGPLLHVAVATAVAVLVPTLAFAVVPGFVGRMAVVLLVATSLAGSLVQSGSLAAAAAAAAAAAPGGREAMLCAGVYGGVMAAVAAVVG